MSATTDDRLPLASLLALAMAAFITILTEALPAGLLPQMAQGLSVSEGWVGQTVTIYAIGSLVAAIPLTVATQGMRRRPLLLAAIAGFVVANSVTALSGSYGLTMVARFLAGVSAGLVWALLAGYAARMVPEHQKGRAIAIAMVGTPLALSLGVPAGTFLGQLVGWRMCFGIMSGLALLLMVWVRFKVPDFAGRAAGKRVPLRHVFTLAGVRPVLFAVLAFVLAHNILYTYIAPFLTAADMVERTDLILLVFGASSLLGIWVVGVLIDHHLRALTLASTLLFGLAALALGVAGNAPTVVYVAVATWGLAFGGSAVRRFGGSAVRRHCFRPLSSRRPERRPTLHNRCWSLPGTRRLPVAASSAACCSNGWASARLHRPCWYCWRRRWGWYWEPGGMVFRRRRVWPGHSGMSHQAAAYFCAAIHVADRLTLDHFALGARVSDNAAGTSTVRSA
jgi:predicted MFS family arabinose efflux permease